MNPFSIRILRSIYSLWFPSQWSFLIWTIRQLNYYNLHILMQSYYDRITNIHWKGIHILQCFSIQLVIDLWWYCFLHKLFFSKYVSEEFLCIRDNSNEGYDVLSAFYMSVKWTLIQLFIYELIIHYLCILRRRKVFSASPLYTLWHKRKNRISNFMDYKK